MMYPSYFSFLFSIWFCQALAAPYVIRIEDNFTSTLLVTSISGTDFSLVAASAPGCALRIIHGNVIERYDDRSFLIGNIISNNITVNGVGCSRSLGGQGMRIYTKDTVPRNILPRVPLSLLESVPLFAGDFQPRKCGDYSDDQLQGYVFSTNFSQIISPLETYGYINNINVVPKQYRENSNAIWMVSAKAAIGVGPSERTCVYYAANYPDSVDDIVINDIEEEQLEVSPEVTSSSEPSIPESNMSRDVEIAVEAQAIPKQEKEKTSTTFEQASADAIAARDSAPSTEKRCFPADATVIMKDGSRKRMENLKVGDIVLASRGVFSEVVLFSHAIPDGTWEFMKIVSESGATIEASFGHYIHVNEKLVAADAVKIGDFVTLADGRSEAVIETSIVSKRGLYNPQTVQGDIVVGEILASTYTTGIYVPTAHALLAPIRAMGTMFRFETNFLEHGASIIDYWMPQGQIVY